MSKDTPFNVANNLITNKKGIRLKYYSHFGNPTQRAYDRVLLEFLSLIH